jgi:hypothetical protein
VGFLDKLKEGAEQAKEMAGQAVDRAKEEARELNLKRQIANAEEELGRAAFDLVDQGAVSHPQLAEGVEAIRRLRAELAGLQASQKGEQPGGQPSEQPGGQPPA